MRDMLPPRRKFHSPHLQRCVASGTDGREGVASLPPTRLGAPWPAPLPWAVESLPPMTFVPPPPPRPALHPSMPASLGLVPERRAPGLALSTHPVVRNVDPAGALGRAGLRNYDVVLGIDGTSMENRTAACLMAELRRGAKALLVRRSEQVIEVPVPPPTAFFWPEEVEHLPRGAAASGPSLATGPTNVLAQEFVPGAPEHGGSATGGSPPGVARARRGTAAAPPSSQGARRPRVAPAAAAAALGAPVSRHGASVAPHALQPTAGPFGSGGGAASRRLAGTCDVGSAPDPQLSTPAGSPTPEVLGRAASSPSASASPASATRLGLAASPSAAAPRYGLGVAGSSPVATGSPSPVLSSASPASRASGTSTPDGLAASILHVTQADFEHAFERAATPIPVSRLAALRVAAGELGEDWVTVGSDDELAASRGVLPTVTET